MRGLNFQNHVYQIGFVFVKREKHMNLDKLKPQGISIFVTAFGALIAVMGTIFGVSALMDPSAAIGYIEGADFMALSWAGRNLGLAVAMGVALWMRTASAYVIVFIGSLCREIGDVLGAFGTGNTEMVPMLIGFLVADLICLAFSVRAMRKS